MEFQNNIRDQLMGVEWPFGTDLIEVTVRAGVSNKGADLDNLIKPILDTYQAIFEEFNDNKVYKIILYKLITPKKEEFLDIEIKGMNNE